MNIFTRIKNKQIELNNINFQINDLNKKLGKINCELKNLINTAKQKKNVKLQVTDHAFVRWLERIRGIPVDDFKTEMLNEIQGYLPDGTHTINGVVYGIKDCTIITVYKP